MFFKIRIQLWHNFCSKLFLKDHHFNFEMIVVVLKCSFKWFNFDMTVVVKCSFIWFNFDMTVVVKCSLQWFNFDMIVVEKCSLQWFNYDMNVVLECFNFVLLRSCCCRLSQWHIACSDQRPSTKIRKESNSRFGQPGNKSMIIY